MKFLLCVFLSLLGSHAALAAQQSAVGRHAISWTQHDSVAKLQGGDRNIDFSFIGLQAARQLIRPALVGVRRRPAVGRI